MDEESPPSSSTPGFRELGSYLFRDEIARTDAGIVYRGYDRADGQPILVKIAHRGLGELRFEAAHADVLRHPQIFRIRDALRTADGELILVQDAPTGRRLADAAPTFEGLYRQIAHFIRETALLLAHVHAHGATHGDLSLRTLYLGEDDQPILSEFGMGVVTGALGGEAPQLDPHAPGVDPAERAERKFKLDERADLFALGAVLYTLLAGRRPSDQPVALLSDPDAPLDDIVPIDTAAPEAPPELRAICAQALSTDPVHRYLHAAALVRDLDAYLHGKRRRPGVIIAFVLVAAATVGLFGLWGATGGGPARTIDVELTVLRAGDMVAAPLENADRAMSRDDTFRLRVELSKPARLTVFYRDPTGRVTELGASAAGPRLTHELPAAGVDGWRAPPPGGGGVLVVVAHQHDLPPALIDGVLVRLGEPPRSFTALTWYGRSLSRFVEPAIEEPRTGAPRSAWKTFAAYADQVIRELSADVDDAAVALVYIVGV